MRKLGLLLVPVLFTACASLTKVAKQNDGLAQVKKIAIVGFSVAYEEPSTGLSEMVKTVKTLSGKNEIKAYTEYKEMDTLYQDFADKIQKETSWEVMPVAKLIGTAKYKSLVRETTEGFQLRPMLGKNMTVLRAHNIIDAGAFASMKPNEKMQLAKELGVDAVIVVNVISTLKVEGGVMKYVGMAEYRPRAQVNVEMFDGRSEKPLWQDSWAWGTADKAVQGTMGIASNAELMEQVKIAVRYGYGDLFSRYKVQ